MLDKCEMKSIRAVGEVKHELGQLFGSEYLHSPSQTGIGGQMPPYTGAQGHFSIFDDL